MSDKTERLALLGTSADPPTCGHKALLEGLLTLFPKVITWASDNPMKQHKASLKERQKMLNALVGEISNPKLRLIQELSSPWTIKTLEKASTKWPTAELVFVIGSDLAQDVPNWAKARDILRKARIAIAPRKGWPIIKSHIEAIETLGGKLEFLPLQIPATASSEVRQKPEPTNIPPSVLQLLLEQNLYGLTPHS